MGKGAENRKTPVRMTFVDSSTMVRDSGVIMACLTCGEKRALGRTDTRVAGAGHAPKVVSVPLAPVGTVSPVNEAHVTVWKSGSATPPPRRG